jgi:hypothetical protein
MAFVWELRGRLNRETGYAVDANTAVSLLEKMAPDAASWWREKIPRFPGRKFLFHSSACEMVDPSPDANASSADGGAQRS